MSRRSLVGPTVNTLCFQVGQIISKARKREKSKTKKDMTTVRRNRSYGERHSLTPAFVQTNFVLCGQNLPFSQQQKSCAAVTHRCSKSRRTAHVSMNASGAQHEWKVATPREKRVVLDSGSWHNRTGDIIRQIHEDVWIIERGYIFLGTIDVGGRTTLIKLPSGGLFVHAPLALTADLKRAIDQIDEVAVVVAPNTEHVDFIAQWKTFYPSATYLGPPGCMSMQSQIPFTRELSRDGTLDESMKKAPVSQFFIASAPFFRETLFIHHPSSSLLCTDFFWAYPTGREVPRPTLAWSWAMNRVYKPIYDNILINNNREFYETLNAVLANDFCEIIPCHGDIITKNGREVLRNFFADKLRDVRRP